MIDFEEFPLVQKLTKKARDEGLTKGRAEDLIKIVETEYGKKGLQEVESQIQAITDENKLFALIEPALISSSLEEFKRTLTNI